MMNKRIIVALDSNNFINCIRIVKLLKDDVYAFKIGYEFFLNFGIEGYKKIKYVSPKIFLDLKLHDIPNTVKKGIEAIEKLKPILTTVHISGGDQMLKSTIIKKNRNTKILGVSILTSLDSNQTLKYYNNKNINSLVKKFIKAAKKFKLDGVVCSPKEIDLVRKEVGNNFLIVTPGIRPEGYKSKNDDQKRTLSPKMAIKKGADLLVIGRPITESKNPLKNLREINKSLK